MKIGVMSATRNDNRRQRTQVLRLRPAGCPAALSHQGWYERHRNRARVKVVKNKSLHLREAQFDILYNEGISRLGDLIDTAVDQNIIAKSGSWFSYKEDRIGRDGMP